MNAQIEAALAVHGLFSGRLGLKYAVIGGIALQFWGDPRFTHDLDITVEDRLELAELVRETTETFGSRVADPYAFARQTRLLLVRVHQVDVDIAVALKGYEDSLFARVRSIEVEPGRHLDICSGEDLVIHKALTGRPQDLADVQGIIQRQGSALDVRYIRRWLGQFSRGLEDPEILDRFRRLWAAR
ncbi:MAG: hypothetical protein FJZ97_02075 [Chloroflexi bacterium]|nr:hypothetical protein [Chloroflexota bacterium]